MYKPVSENKPYGFSQIESLLVLLKYTVLLVVVINMIVSNVKILLNGGHTVDAFSVLMYESTLCFFCILMLLLLKHLSRSYSSLMIQSELYLWKGRCCKYTWYICCFFIPAIACKYRTEIHNSIH